METDTSTKLARYEELAEKISNYTDKVQKKTAFESLLNRINVLIPDAIADNLQAIQDYATFSLTDYKKSYSVIGNLMRFIGSNIDEIQLFENDSEEQQRERNLKYDQFKRYVMEKENKIYGGYDYSDRNRKIGVPHPLYPERAVLEIKPNPDWIYSQFGTFTQYLSSKQHRYFSICLNIKKSGRSDFVTANYLVLLYIAISNELSITNHELSIINEELELLGTIPRQQSLQTGTTIDKANTDKPQRTIDVERLRPYFKPAFKGKGNSGINYFEWLVSHLQDNRSAKAFAQIALMIHESNTALNSRRPDAFEEWYLIFCECVGCVKRSYRPSHLRPFPESLTKLFNYLL
ncbi:MAG: hypothetical protein LBL90_03425 [Prevotellaceae bacterium]|nr:hypothetical protein [Prevotellaceae bacterium]